MEPCRPDINALAAETEKNTFDLLKTELEIAANFVCMAETDMLLDHTEHAQALLAKAERTSDGIKQFLPGVGEFKHQYTADRKQLETIESTVRNAHHADCAR